MRNCMGSEVGRQEDVTSQPLGGPSTSQLGATLRSGASPPALLAVSCSSHSRVSSDPERGEGGETLNGKIGAGVCLVSLPPALRREEEQRLCPLGFGPFPEDLGWERVLLTRGGGGLILGCGRGETDLGHSETYSRQNWSQILSLGGPYASPSNHFQKWERFSILRQFPVFILIDWV